MADERGSIVSISDSAGSIININAYDEYGIPAPGNVGRFGYTGQIWLPEVKLWYYKARMYSPTLGRFLQTDPIGYADGMNWYNYVGGDPVNFVDPLGLEMCPDGSGDICSTAKRLHYCDRPENSLHCGAGRGPGDGVPGLPGGNDGGHPAPCGPTKSTAGKIADEAEKLAAGADVVSAVGLAASTTVVGAPVGLPTAVAARGASALANVVALGANVVDGNARGALTSVGGIVAGRLGRAGTKRIIDGIFGKQNFTPNVFQNRASVALKDGAENLTSRAVTQAACSAITR